MNIFRLLILTCILIVARESSSQSLTIGSGTFTNSNFFGPANTSTLTSSCSRFAYIYPASLLKKLVQGDTISFLEFHRNGNGIGLSGSATMQIFLRTTVKTDFGAGNINWVNESKSTGMKKTYSKDPVSDIGSQEGWRRFYLSTPFVYDTLLGKNLEILIEYTQNNSQSDNIYWNYDNSTYVSAYAVNQTKFFSGILPLPDTTNQSSERHPQLRIGFPRVNTDATVIKIYSLGKIPVPLGNPDTIKALFRNDGKQNLAGLKTYIISKGANKYIDSFYISLARGEEKLYTLPIFKIKKTGLDTLEVRIFKDDNDSNNRLQSLRLATDNIYSYRDISLPPSPGGIGFNGTTGDFVARFYSDSLKSINQITVNFGVSGNNFKLGIWKADGVNGSPGTNIWTSDSLVSKATFLTPVYPPVKVSGNFYVGVRQIMLSNVAFGYQIEEPVRSNTFFYTAPSGNTSWADFAPDAPYKFLIEPRIQAQNDVAPFSYDSPKDTIKLAGFKATAPKATIYNYGSNDQKVPFDVTLRIRQYNNIIYTSTKKDTLSSGRKHQITFDTTFKPTQPGNYQVEVITRLANDQVKDNDTLKYNIFVALYKDVGLTTLFEPSRGASYEIGIDTIYPVVSVNNFGVDKQGPFVVKAMIYDATNTLIYSDSKSISLGSLASSLMSFKLFSPSKTGNYHFIAFTTLNIDTDRSNDTTRADFSFIRSNDVAVTAINYPAPGSSVTPSLITIAPMATVSNAGQENQPTPFTVVCYIYKNNVKVYSDSVKIASYMGSPNSISFAKTFVPNIKGYYSMKVISRLPGDQDRKNDTLSSIFAVGVPDDVQPVSIIPSDTSALELNMVFKPQAVIRNNGFNSQLTPFDVHYDIYAGASKVYFSVKNITLDSGTSTTVTFDDFKPSKEVVYSVVVYTTLFNDFVKSNDTLKLFYNIVKSHDVLPYYISVPDTVITYNQVFNPAAGIKNVGLSDENTPFPVYVIIKDPLGTIVYFESHDTILEKGGTALITFNQNFSATKKGIYSIIVFTKLPTDQQILNDTFKSTFVSIIRTDIAAVNMLYPANTATIKSNTGIIAPKAVIKNNGLDSEDSATVKLKIYNKGNGSLVYSSSKIKAINAGQTLTVYFDSTFSTSTPGNYRTLLTVTTTGDQLRQNDTIEETFTISDNTGITANDAGGFKIYPNPAVSNLYILSENNDVKTVSLFDVTGKKVFDKIYSSKEIVVSVKGLASGIYTIELQMQNGTVNREKIVVAGE
ncbi:MAG: T9SS type A sorting domain-containing protein [Bacteroidia bacterium]|nr:T9SS type A sorting domain-containing protein [Bacteroidia bacterium]